MKTYSLRKYLTTLFALPLFFFAFLFVQPSYAEWCGDSSPAGTPDLFQIDAQATSATLYFTPVSGSSYYFIAFGHVPGDKQYGGEFGVGQDGVQAITVDHLMPQTQYTFTVRGGSGCMPGQWSNEITIKTGVDGTLTTFYKDIPMEIQNMSVAPGAMSKTVSVGKETAPSPSVTPKTEEKKEAKGEAEPTVTPTKRCFLGICL